MITSLITILIMLPIVYFGLKYINNSTNTPIQAIPERSEPDAKEIHGMSIVAFSDGTFAVRRKRNRYSGKGNLCGDKIEFRSFQLSDSWWESDNIGYCKFNTFKKALGVLNDELIILGHVDGFTKPVITATNYY